MAVEQPSGGLDAFTRRYLIVLASLIAAALLWWLVSQDSRVAQINAALRADEQLSAYPYVFRVLTLENGVAQVSSPRSAQMSAIQGLRIMFPALQQASAVSAEMMAAQEELARLQSHASDIVSRHEDVRQVRWVLDEQWLARYGVYVQ